MSVRTTHGLWHYSDRPLTDLEDANRDGVRDLSHDNTSVVEETVLVEDDRSGWDADSWQTGAGGFGLLGLDSPCPHYTGARTHTDITGLEVRRLMLRSWFYVAAGVISVNMRLTSDQPAHLYVNGDLVAEHQPMDFVNGGNGCPSSTEHSLSLWYAPDGAHDDNDNYQNEISLVAHANVTFVDVEITAVRCENVLDCGQEQTCAEGEPCGPSCTCSIDLGMPASVVHVGSGSIARGVCVLNRCGDGIIQQPWEECDDGNTIDDDTCSDKCRLNLNEGGCHVGLLTAEGMKQELEELQADLAAAIQSEDQPLIAELKGKVELLATRLARLQSGEGNGLVDGFDAVGRYCNGTCLGGDPCQAQWRSDGRILDHCRCGNYDPSLCQVRVSDVLRLKPSQLGRGAGIDSRGRWCSGNCPGSDEGGMTRCSGTWGQVQGQDALISCECEQADGCRVDPGDGEEGHGVCGGACNNNVLGTNNAAFAAVSVLEHEIAPCFPTYDGEFMISCNCRPDDPVETGCQRVADSDGVVSCDGTCKESGEECTWSEDESGRKMCGCPAPQDPGVCRVDTKLNICVGGCDGDNSVCLPRYYQSSALLSAAITPRLVGCECVERLEPGCRLAVIPGLNAATSTTTCAGTCVATGNPCAFRMVGQVQLCGCDDIVEHGPCRLDQEANACKGVSECDDDIVGNGPSTACKPIEVSIHPEHGTKVLQCGCPARPWANDTWANNSNRCFGQLAGTSLDCAGTYDRGVLTGCGRREQETSVMCTVDAREGGTCVVRPLARELGMSGRPRLTVVYAAEPTRRRTAPVYMPTAIVTVEFDGDDEGLAGLHVTVLPSPAPTCDRAAADSTSKCVPPVAGTVLHPATQRPPRLVPLGINFALVASHATNETVAPVAHPTRPIAVVIRLGARPLVFFGQIFLMAVSQAVATNPEEPADAAWMLPGAPGSGGPCMGKWAVYDWQQRTLSASVCEFTQYAVFVSDHKWRQRTKTTTVRRTTSRRPHCANDENCRSVNCTSTGECHLCDNFHYLHQGTIPAG